MHETTTPLSETDIPQKAEQTWNAAKTGIADGFCEGKALVRSNPLLTVLGALAAGVVLGCLVSHRDKPTRRERYIDEPLEDLQALARTLSERAARQASRGGDAAIGAMDSVLSRIKNSLKF
jgi:hypothetical protein